MCQRRLMRGEEKTQESNSVELLRARPRFGNATSLHLSRSCKKPLLAFGGRVYCTMRTNGIFYPDGDADAAVRINFVREFHGSHRCQIRPAQEGTVFGRRIFWKAPIEIGPAVDRRTEPRRKKVPSVAEKLEGLERMKRWRAEKRAGGWCGRCGKRKREKGRSNCAVCREYGIGLAARRARVDV